MKPTWCFCALHRRVTSCHSPVSCRFTHAVVRPFFCFFFPASPFVITFDLVLYVNSAHTRAISQTNSSSRWVYRKVICLAWIRRCNLWWGFFLFFFSLLSARHLSRDVKRWAWGCWLNFPVHFISLKSLFDYSCVWNCLLFNPARSFSSSERSCLLTSSICSSGPRLFVFAFAALSGCAHTRFVWLVWALAWYAF